MNMNDQQFEQLMEKLDQVINAINKTPPKSTKKAQTQKELNPIQQAVKNATNSKATREEFLKALETIYTSPEQLSNKQVAFVLFFGMLNHKDLGEDVNYWFDLQLGKRKYNQRTDATEEIRNIIQQSYKGDAKFKQKIDNYLVSKEK